MKPQPDFKFMAKRVNCLLLALTHIRKEYDHINEKTLAIEIVTNMENEIEKLMEELCYTREWIATEIRRPKIPKKCRPSITGETIKGLAKHHNIVNMLKFYEGNL